MHGGRVSALSSLGHGSEFVVHLPVALAAEPHPSSPPGETAVPSGPSLRVLVVDDSVDTVSSLALVLRESGHDVRTALDGLSALEAALDHPPDVVLLDIGLPGLDGYEVARRMREQPLLSKTVLVAMTGYGLESDRQRTKQAGIDHHLVKPIRFDQLHEIFASVAGRPA